MKALQAVLLILAGSLSGTVSWAAPGFFSISDSRVPNSVRKASLGVFQIVVWSSEPKIVIPRSRYRPTLKEWRKHDRISQLSAEELEACARINKETCGIHFTGMGTVFMAESQDTLWTVRHNFDFSIEKLRSQMPAGLNILEQYRRIMKMPLHFVLLNSVGEIVFDTRRGTDSAKFSFVGDQQLIRGLSWASDFAQIKLSRKLPGTPISLATARADLNSQIFVAGYPTVSENRSRRYFAPDSDGLTFRISKGKFLGAPNGYLAKDNKFTPEQLLYLDTSFVFHDVDGIPGQSGGPILNSDGKVIGVFSNHVRVEGTAGPEDDYAAAGGLGLSLIGISELKNDINSLLQ